MKTIQKVYFSGLGAVGCSYASKFYEMDPDCIKIIADKERIERYIKEGITINGKQYNFRYITPEEDSAPADLIIIAVKQRHLDQSIKDIRKFVGSDTIILSLLNGIVSEEIIGREYGMEKLLYSICVRIDAVRVGTNIRFSNIGMIVFGDKTNIIYSPDVTAVKNLFDKVGIPYSVPENMIRELWWKFMMNVGMNQTSAILRAPYGVYQKVQEARELTRMASLEVVRLSEKVGINLQEEDIDKYINIVNTLSPEGKTSMLQDIEAGRKTEVEIFAGTVIELGSKYRVATPVNDMLYKMIRTLESI